MFNSTKLFLLSKHDSENSRDTLCVIMQQNEYHTSLISEHITMMEVKPSWLVSLSLLFINMIFV